MEAGSERAVSSVAILVAEAVQAYVVPVEMPLALRRELQERASVAQEAVLRRARPVSPEAGLEVAEARMAPQVVPEVQVQPVQEVEGAERALMPPAHSAVDLPEEVRVSLQVVRLEPEQVGQAVLARHPMTIVRPGPQVEAVRRIQPV